MPYKVGVGVADMTGPIAAIALMGYADPKQLGGGIHTRQFARSFIIDNNQTRVVLVSAEIHVVGIALRREVVRSLKKMYKKTYTLTNVFISATHTFSTPGGFLGDFLLDINNMGFSNEVFYAYCDGITRSIVRAHTNMVGARLFYAEAKVWNAQMNRNPKAYMNNPKPERARYSMNTDNTLSQIRIQKKKEKILGLINIFAVQANNLPPSNLLVSSDNIGYAALALEKALNPGLASNGKGAVVGAFFVGNAGDISANLLGGRCKDDNKPCDNRFQTCKINAKDKKKKKIAGPCLPVGPAPLPRDSAKIIGSSIYESAMRAMVSSDAIELSPNMTNGILRVIYQNVQPAKENVSKWEPISKQFNSSAIVNGCIPCFGSYYSNGNVDYKPVITTAKNNEYLTGNALLDALRSGALMNLQTENDTSCQKPKDIWLATGRARYVLPWHHISSIFVINLGGEVFLIGVPGEVSTMAGRRIREAIKTETNKAAKRGIIMSVTNEYVHHIVTSEEYQEDTIENPGPKPMYFKDQAVSLVRPAVYDKQATYETTRWKYFYLGTYYGKEYAYHIRNWGWIVDDPDTTSPTGREINCKFMGGNPRNELFQEMTHFAIEKWEESSNNYYSYLSDADWDTRMEWTQGKDFVNWLTIYWDIPATARYAYYRFHYFGAVRNPITGIAYYFESASSATYVSYKY